MLKQTYYNRFKGWGQEPPKGDIVDFVMRTNGHILSPSYELLGLWQNKRIVWDKFVRIFKNEMKNERCQKYMKKLKELSKTKDVWLVCSCYNGDNHCHRFILMELINEIKDD